VQRAPVHFGLVRRGVLPGVIDQGELVLRSAEGPETARELVHHERELGDVGTVTGIGMAHEGDPAVDRDHEPEADEAKVAALLFGMAPLGDRRLVVGRVDIGGEVGHVEHEARTVEVEGLDHVGNDTSLDLGELGGRDLVHGIPKAPVVERLSGKLHEPIAGGRRPPVREGELGARGHDTVEDQKSDIGPDRCRSIRASGPDHLIDDLGDTKPFDHRPGGCEITEAKVSRAFGDRDRTCHSSLDVLCFAEVALPGHLRLAVHAGHLAQVVVRLPVGHDKSHTLGLTPSGDKSRAFDQDIRAGQGPILKKSLRKGSSR
jgi:hypothetical protein